MIDWRQFAAAVIDSYGPSVTAHLVVSTVFLLLGLTTVVLFRNRLTAAARFAILFIAIAKFAVPAALLAPIVAALMPQAAVPAASGGIEASLAILADALRFEPPPPSVKGWVGAIVTAWLLVAIVLVVRPAIVRRRLTSLSLRTALPPSAREVAALERARRHIGVRRGIDLARSPLPEAPAVLRIFRPVIVLPLHTCDELSDEELESLLCHECAHVRRHDNLTARFESLICALFWFHPLLWIARRINALERERACDEAAAASPEEGERYRAALSKFCHALIVPREPGVSCMATAKLKERIEHVMNYPRLKAHSPSASRVAVAAAAMLALFTLVSAIGGSETLLPATPQPYSIRVNAEKTADTITFQGRVVDGTTQKVIAAPAFSLGTGQAARATVAASGLDILFDIRPGGGEALEVEVIIRRDGEIEQENVLRVSPTVAKAADARARRYTGAPMSLNVKDADIRDLLKTFGQLTGLDIRPDPAIEGTVSVNWVNVPWDQALDEILKDQNLVYRLEGSVMHISKK